MLIEGFNFEEIVFELTIFFLLCLAVYDLSKKYFIPLLYSEINAIKKKEKDDKEKNNLLSLSKKRIDNEISEQEDKFSLLEKKVQVWRNSLDVESDKTTKNDSIIIKNTKEKRRIQEANLNLLNMERIVVPESIKLAYKEIGSLYAGEKGRALLDELLVKIEPK